MKHVLISILSAGALAACGGDGDSRSNADLAAVERAASRPPPPPPPPPPPAAAVQRSAGIVSDAQFAPTAPAPEPVAPDEDGAQYIAYSHDLGLSLPREGVERLMTAHVAACQEAGPRACIVINSNINKQSDDYTSAYLSLRAKPDWIDGFLAGVDQDADAAGGEVVSRNTRAEDLTRVILDTDARLNAQRTLKRRLEDLLATRDGELGELLQTERELARVTGEIESITSNLRALRLRVDMSELTVRYETKRSLVSGGRRNPLFAALGDFFYNMSSALAAVVTAFAIGLPWMILIGLLLFIWLRAIWPWVRRRRQKS